MLAEVLQEHRDAVFERWIERVISAYPEETGRFLRETADQFANPVGAGLREGLSRIVNGLADDAEPEDFRAALDLVIRVRAVQQFSPAEAVGFVFDLKEIIHGVCALEKSADHTLSAEVDRRVDQLGLLAFDIYSSCREKVWSIRAEEIRSQSLGILERVQEWRARREEMSENASE